MSDISNTASTTTMSAGARDVPTGGANVGGVNPPTTSGLAGGPISNHVTIEQVRDMIHQSEEKTQSKLERLESSIEQRLEHLPTIHQMIYVVGGGVLTGVLAVLALMAFGRDRFDAGIQFTTGTIQYQIEAKKAADDYAKKLNEIFDLLKQHKQDEPANQNKKPPSSPSAGKPGG